MLRKRRIAESYVVNEITARTVSKEAYVESLIRSLRGDKLLKKETNGRQTLEPEKFRGRRKQVGEDLAYIKARYGIHVHPEMRRHLPPAEADIIRFEKLNLLEAAASLRTLRQELAKYPQEFLTFCHLRRLWLVKALYAQEPYLQAEACYAGKSYLEDRTVYLATSGEGRYALKGTLHHELFHLSDFEQIQRDLQTSRFRDLSLAMYQRIYDSQWEELNPQGEKAYSGPTDFAHSAQGQGHDLEGFVLAIGKIDPWEDRATIAGTLMADPKAAYEKAQQDKIVDAKLSRIMSFYKERSGGKMDERYFADLVVGKVTEGYWKQPSR